MKTLFIAILHKALKYFLKFTLSGHSEYNLKLQIRVFFCVFVFVFFSDTVRQKVNKNCLKFHQN